MRKLTPCIGLCPLKNQWCATLVNKTASFCLENGAQKGRTGYASATRGLQNARERWYFQSKFPMIRSLDPQNHPKILRLSSFQVKKWGLSPKHSLQEQSWDRPGPPATQPAVLCCPPRLPRGSCPLLCTVLVLQSPCPWPCAAWGHSRSPPPTGQTGRPGFSAHAHKATAVWGTPAKAMRAEASGPFQACSIQSPAWGPHSLSPSLLATADDSRCRETLIHQMKDPDSQMAAYSWPPSKLHWSGTWARNELSLY